jgi:hypothetical protein
MQSHAYIIRLWRESAHSHWRISLQDTTTGERRGFASLGEAVEFLAGEVELNPFGDATARPDRASDEEQSGALHDA